MLTAINNIREDCRSLAPTLLAGSLYRPKRTRVHSKNWNNPDNNHRPTTKTTIDYFNLLKNCSTTIGILILLSTILSQVSGTSVDPDSIVAAISSSSSSSSTPLTLISSSSLLQQQQQPVGDDRKQGASDVIAIKEGGDLDLSCPIVVQNEDMIISWTCDNEPANIRSSRIHVTESGKLRIHSAKVGDSCNYRCEAADGFETFSVIIKVIIVDRRLMNQLTRLAGIIGQGIDSPSLSNDAKTSQQHQTASRELSPARDTQQIDPKLKSLPDNSPDIELYIKPSEVQASKNRTFSLECRIKHDPNLVPPQIIWLKEYIGAHIDSLDEALEKSLIVFDGVYYHSLNWPRALSYSKQSSTVSSALLVKQASYVHSGWYACFAGYPASMMNLHFNNSLSATKNTAASHGDQATQPRPLMRYKIARALVRVDDKEGEANYKSSINSNFKTNKADDSRKPTNVLVNVVSSNTWIRNLTIILLVFSISLVAFKFVGVRRSNSRMSLESNLGATTNNDIPTSNAPRRLIEHPQSYVGVIPNSEIDPMPELALDRFNSSHAPANSLINDNNPLEEFYKIDQALLNERLSFINSLGTYNNNNNSDHIYSEIGNRINMSNGEEPYYKIPNSVNKQ